MYDAALVSLLAQLTMVRCVRCGLHAGAIVEETKVHLMIADSRLRTTSPLAK